MEARTTKAPVGLATTLIIALALLIGTPGCQQSAYVNYDDERVYPSMLQGEVLDVQVFRIGTRIRLTNTTAKSLPAGTLWLNRWYSQEIDTLAPGGSISLSLKKFEDRFGEPFRAGGFFATRIPDLVFLAQLETEDELFGLIVVEDRAE